MQTNEVRFVEKNLFNANNFTDPINNKQTK